MILQGLILTITGMAIVFIFLSLLVVVMKLLAYAAIKYFPAAEEIKKKEINPEIAAVLAGIKHYFPRAVPEENREIAAAVAAVRHYKQ